MLDLDPRDWPAVSALLDEALDLSPDARGAWLDALPPEAAAHRETLRRLLEAEASAETNGLFSQAPLVGFDPARVDEGDEALGPDARVGPYVLIAPIGKGGMGSVWLAERADGQPKRKVALKLPHVGWDPDDIERHLAHAPVLARPDTLGYRARKFVARHSLQVGAAALVLAAVMTGAGVALWQARAARLEAVRAEEVKRFALSLFKAADSAAGAGVETTASDLLVAAERRIDTELKDRPDIAVELMTSIGSSLDSQSKAAEAAALMKRAVALAELHFGRDDPRTVAAAAVYGQALSDMTHDDEAIAVLDDVAVRARRLHMPHELSLALAYQASARIAKGDTDGGVASAKGAIDALEPGTDIDPEDRVGAWLTYAYALGRAGRPGVGDAARQALAISQQAFGDRTTNNTLTARQNIAEGLADEGRLREAIAELDRVLDDGVRYYGPMHRNVSVIASTLARYRQEAGDLDGAAKAYRQSIEISAQPQGEGPYTVAVVTYRLGQTAAIGGRWAEALDDFDRALTILEGVASAPSWSLGSVKVARAIALTHLDRLDEADKIYASLGEAANDPKLLPQVKGGLAEPRTRQGRSTEAVALARDASQALPGDAPVRVRAEGLLSSARVSSVARHCDWARRATRMLASKPTIWSCPIPHSASLANSN